MSTLTGRALEIYQELLGMIRQLPEGCMLPSIKKLQEKFHCGQGSLTEAAGKLDSEGLIKRIPRKGLMVCRKIATEDESAKQGTAPVFPVNFIEYKQVSLGFFGPVPHVYLKLVKAFNKSVRRNAIAVKEFPSLRGLDWNSITDLPDIAFFPGKPIEVDCRNFSPYYFSDLSPMIKEMDMEKYYPGFHEISPNGLAWGICPTLDTHLILYNKTALTDAGLPEPVSAWTWNNVLEYARRLSVSGSYSFAFTGYMNFMFHWGVNFIDEKTGKFILNHKELPSAIEYLNEMIAIRKFCPYFSKLLKNFRAVGNWMETLPLMEYGAVYLPAKMRASGKYGAVEMPMRKDGRSFKQYSILAINNIAYDFECCWQFMSFILSETGQRIIARDGRAFPVMKRIIPENIPPEFVKPAQRALARKSTELESYYLPYRVRFIIECAIDRYLRYGGCFDSVIAFIRKSCDLELSKLNVQL